MRRRTWSVLALLPLLQGCLTAHMWASYEPAEAAPVRVFVAAESSEHEGALLTSPRGADDGMVWIGDGGHQAWHLRQSRADGLVGALLQDDAFCEVARADISATRSYVDYTVARDDAELELRVRVRGSRITRELDEARLHPRAREVLAVERRNAFLLAADPELFLSPLCRKCVYRLSGVDFGALFGEPGRWQVESFVFVDGHGVPDGDPPVPQDASIFGFTADRLSLPQQLRALRQRSLLLKLRGGGQARVVEVRADRAWLLAALSEHGAPGEFVHRSAWRLEPAGSADELPPAGDAVMLASVLALEERSYTNGYPLALDEGLIERVLWTPITLVADVALGPGLVQLLDWLFGDGDGELLPGGRRRDQ